MADSRLCTLANGVLLRLLQYILTLKSMLLMILCGIMEYCSPQYFTSVSKANIVLESQISVTAFKTPQ